MGDKFLLTICPCCGNLAYGNGRSNIACNHCGFAFIVHDETIDEETIAKTVQNLADLMADVMKDIADGLNRMAECLKKGGTNER